MKQPSPSAIRRNIDRRGLHDFACGTAACALLACALLLHAGVRTLVTERGYRLSRLSAEYRELTREHETLQFARRSWYGRSASRSWPGRGWAWGRRPASAWSSWSEAPP